VTVWIFGRKPNPAMKAKEISMRKMQSGRTTIEHPAEPENDEKGISLLECAVVTVLVAMAVATFNAGFSASLSNLFTRVITFLG
jgi:Flp pilus assembly pilin Flp